MAAKTVINFLVENTVNQGATVTDQSEIVPNGAKVKLLRFGGYERVLGNNTGVMALQWGSTASGWTTIRVGGGPAAFEFTLNKTFVGDGAKRFRFVRQNRDPVLSAAKEMVMWAEAIVL